MFNLSNSKSATRTLSVTNKQKKAPTSCVARFDRSSKRLLSCSDRGVTNNKKEDEKTKGNGTSVFSAATRSSSSSSRSYKPQTSNTSTECFRDQKGRKIPRAAHRPSFRQEALSVNGGEQIMIDRCSILQQICSPVHCPLRIWIERDSSW